MTKRATLIDKILAGLDAKIAELQQTRQHILDARAVLERRRSAPTTKPPTNGASTRRGQPAGPPAAQ
jgi:hypothetical protein